jgi:catechol 2,3-dioxygenase-like lactoylglutathione lyase family enzyme
MSNTTTFTQGVHHAGLTVPDLEKARKFFIEVLGFVRVGGSLNTRLSLCLMVSS